MESKNLSGKREIEADVVVVGYGCAGAVAAFTAHDAGAKVVILEMMAEGGGASKISNGGIAIPLAPEFGDYLYKICNGLTDRELLDTYVEHAMKLEDVLSSRSAPISSGGRPRRSACPSRPWPVRAGPRSKAASRWPGAT